MARVDIELALDWQDRCARHRDRQFFAGIDLARDTVAGVPLAGLGATIGLPPPDPALRQWRPAGDLRQPARLGRWLPRSVLADGRREDRRPFRVAALDGGRVLTDGNNPLAGIPLVPSLTVLGPSELPDPGFSRDLLDLVSISGPGMQAALPDADTDFLADDPFARADETPDPRFYSHERLVDHLDGPTRAGIAAHYRRVLRPAMRVLDLMASWDSHLPPALSLTVTGLGMNTVELERNARLAERLVHDLNARPELPFGDGGFDAALCALSIEYLIQPIAVVREVARVLKPGAPFVVSFSDRWFPPKAIRLWTGLHPFERLAFVADLLRLSGRFERIETETLLGLPAPQGQWRPQGRPFADPLFLVTGYRAAPGKVSGGDTGAG